MATLDVVDRAAGGPKFGGGFQGAAQTGRGSDVVLGPHPDAQIATIHAKRTTSPRHIWIPYSPSDMWARFVLKALHRTIGGANSSEKDRKWPACWYAGYAAPRE